MTRLEGGESAFRTGLLPARTGLSGVVVMGGIGWEYPMRPALAVMTALLLFGSGIAEAADSALLAQTAGLLLGNAHRCGVPTDRVEHAEKVIHRLIVAASYDPTEETAANSRFAETYRASAFPD